MRYLVSNVSLKIVVFFVVSLVMVKSSAMEVGQKTTPMSKQLKFAELKNAIRLDSELRVEELIKAGFPINQGNKNGKTPLCYAAKNLKREGIVRLLLDNGADANVCNNRGWSPLHYAASVGNIKVAKLLVVNDKAVVNIQDNVGRLPLHVAVDASKPQLKMVKWLLRRKPNACLVQAKDTKYSPLHMAIAKIFYLKEFYEIAKVLILHCPKALNLYDIDGLNPFHLAVMRGDEALVMLCLSFGTDINAFTTNSPPRTALYDAVSRGRINVIKLLLANQHIMVDKCNNLDQKTPLHVAVAIESLKTIKRLVNRGAEINCQDCDGLTPLHSAVRYHWGASSLKMVEYLLQKKALINIKEYATGMTPLDYAVARSLEHVRYFIKHVGGAIFAGKHLYYAVRRSSEDTVKLLLACKNVCNEINVPIGIGYERGFTSLHCAAKNGAKNIVQLLLEHGADPFCLTNVEKDAQTALEIAMNNGKNECAELLRQAMSKIVELELVECNICYANLSLGGSDALDRAKGCELGCCLEKILCNECYEKLEDKSKNKKIKLLCPFCWQDMCKKVQSDDKKIEPGFFQGLDNLGKLHDDQ